MIAEITDKTQKSDIARRILESLPDWFGVEASRERYIADSREEPFFAALEGERPVGFLCLKPTGSATVELAVMGVLPSLHRQGHGRQLVEAAVRWAREAGYRFMQVKTVKPGVYEDYDRTNRFYRSMGFEEFEVIPELWGEENPCQIYVMGI